MRLRRPATVALLVLTSSLFYASHWSGCLLDRAVVCGSRLARTYPGTSHVHLSDLTYNSIYTPAPVAVSGTLFFLLVRYAFHLRRDAVPHAWRAVYAPFCNLGLVLLLVYLCAPSGGSTAYTLFHLVPVQAGLCLWSLQLLIFAVAHRWWWTRLFVLLGAGGLLATLIGVCDVPGPRWYVVWGQSVGLFALAASVVCILYRR